MEELERANVELRKERDAALAELQARTAALERRTSEYGERIEQQAATIDVLKAMSASPGDAQPVFDLIVRRAQELCNGTAIALLEFDGQLVHFRSEYGALQHITPDVLQAYKDQYPMVPTPTLNSHRAMLEKRIIHVRDMDAEPEANEASRVMGWGSEVQVPLLRGGECLGVMALISMHKRGVSDTQIELVKTFAEQAVIAITSAETYRALQTRTSELQESLEYQTATSDVLKVISRSTFDLQPVLTLVGETAARLCAADQAVIIRYENGIIEMVANFGFPPEYEAALRKLGPHRLVVDAPMVVYRAITERRVVHIHDVAAVSGYAIEPIKLGQQRTSLGVPLLRAGEPIGSILLARRRVEPFTDRQIELVNTFADQAVIAIENARLINEQREALEQQTATAEVLQVINLSPGDLQPVFTAMVERAATLCEADEAAVRTFDGSALNLVATHGPAVIFAELMRLGPSHPDGLYEAIAQGASVTHFADVRETEAFQTNARARDRLELRGIRSWLAVALRKEGELLGVINVHRREVRPFAEKQIALLQNFAAQAVIAMENARLLTEQREALEQQTATAEVLQVINANPGNLTPVFDAVLEKAIRLCDSAFGVLQTYDGHIMRCVAMRGLTPEQEALLVDRPPAPGQPTGRIAGGEDVVHLSDAREQDGYRAGFGPTRDFVDQVGARTAMWAALRKDKKLLGILTIFRREVRAFADKEVALVQNFAVQAVIAMENARLLDEIRQRQEELRVTFENMGDGVAMFNETQHLVAWNGKFQEIVDLPDTLLEQHCTYEEYLRFLAVRGDFGASVDTGEQVLALVASTGHPYGYERTRPDGRVIEIRRNPVPDGGFVLMYSDITERKRSEAEIRAARDAAEAALRELKAAQANLIQAEKMASLGQLTAGIAHEIKNPLNFVNNFAALSVDLLGELKEAAAPGFAALSEKQRAEIVDVSTMLTSNLEKITEHGKRADGIVKAMLEHSRGSSGERRIVDLNALIDEALNLAYHGARAQDPNFTITLERNLADRIAPIEVNPQDMMRVFLNLFANGFYAVTRRRRSGGDDGFVPMLKVTTRDAGEAVEIRVRDNGTGIPADIRDKLFQPFFTTKPTGEGTGLGLSITYDIVTQQHGGSIAVDSEVCAYSEFTIQLPRNP